MQSLMLRPPYRPATQNPWVIPVRIEIETPFGSKLNSALSGGGYAAIRAEEMRFVYDRNHEFA